MTAPNVWSDVPIPLPQRLANDPLAFKRPIPELRNCTCTPLRVFPKTSVTLAEIRAGAPDFKLLADVVETITRAPDAFG